MITNTANIELAPVRIGDRVRLRETASFHVGAIGIVTKADIPIARAFEIGYDSFGVIEVEIDANTRWQGHYSHVEQIGSVTDSRKRSER